MRITAGTVLMSLAVFVSTDRAATERVRPPNVLLIEPAASNPANGQRRYEVAAAKSNAARPQTSLLGRLDLPGGRYRITFRVRSQPDPWFRLNSLCLERLQK